MVPHFLFNMIILFNKKFIYDSNYIREGFQKV